MGVFRVWVLVVFLTISACAVTKIRSSYQIYRVSAPSSATSFGKLDADMSQIVSHSYQDAADIPMQLTASDGTGLDLRQLQVRSVIDGPLAFTELRMTFHNPHNRELEGRFQITLPANASVARLAMKTARGWQDAEIVGRSRGQDVYEAFLHQQVDPVLLEADVGNQFRARVYPIEAKGDKEIIISYSEQLAAGGDYRLLLKGLPEVELLDVDVLHGDKRKTYKFRDFLAKVDLVVPTELPEATAVRSDELVMMRWVPQSHSGSDVPRKILILVDSSASSAGLYGQQVNAVKNLANALASEFGDSTKLEVACFDNDVESIFRGHAGQYGARQSLALLEHGALGASNVEKALRWANERAERVILVSDGIATAGARDLIPLNAALKLGLIERIDVLAFAHGRATSVLEGLASGEGRRAGILLDTHDTAQKWAIEIGTEAPEELSLDVVGADWVWPEKVRSRGAGQPVVVFAKFGKEDARRLMTIEVQQTAGATKSTTQIPVQDGMRALVQREWVAGQLQRLGKRQQQSPNQDREKLIAQLSHQFRVLTPSTSFLMLETDEEYRQFGINRNRAGDILTIDATGLRRIVKNREHVDRQYWRTLMESPRRLSETVLPEFSHVTSDPVMGDRAAMAGIVHVADDGTSLGGVVIVVVHDETKEEFTTLTDEHGKFSIGDLPAGRYSIVMAFATAKQVFSDVLLETGHTTKVETTIDLSGVGETIEISGRPNIDTASTSQSIVLDTTSLENLPMPNKAGQHVSSESRNLHPIVKRSPRASGRSAQFRKVRRMLGGESVDLGLKAALHWYSAAPASVLALLALGESLEASGHYKLASRAYASVLDVHPSRADMHRLVAARLSTLGNSIRSLRIDALRFAYESRPDHAHGLRLLAMELATDGREREALYLLLEALETQDSRGRYEQMRELLRHEIGIIAAAWLARDPSKSELIKAKLDSSGIMVPMHPLPYAVLSWESDVAKLDLLVRTTDSSKKISGDTIDVGAIGYGPEAFLPNKDTPTEHRLFIKFSEQAMTGYAFTQLQIVDFDSTGLLRVENRPMVLFEPGEVVAMGSF